MTTNSTPKPPHLESSPLGTKQYWDSLYTTELQTHVLDPTNPGTIWFTDSSAEEKLISFLEEQILDSNILGKNIGRDNCTFLDLGTGNGHFLGMLRGGGEGDGDGEEDEGDEVDGEREEKSDGRRWKGRMMGVDYSIKSIEFARRIAEEKGFGSDRGKEEIEFQHWDIMTQPPHLTILTGDCEKGWDVVLDKGTFDAISLSEEKDAEGRRICEGYNERVLPLMREGGVFLVTSCNWTSGELNAWFEGGGLEVLGCVGYKSFRFGGREGQCVSSVCYRKYSR